MWGYGKIRWQLSCILDYMAAIGQGHIVREMDCPALSESIFKAVLRGLKNMERLKNGKGSHGGPHEKGQAVAQQ